MAPQRGRRNMGENMKQEALKVPVDVFTKKVTN